MLRLLGFIASVRLVCFMLQLMHQDAWITMIKDQHAVVKGSVITQNHRDFAIKLSHLDGRPWHGMLSIRGHCDGCVMGMTGRWQVQALKPIVLGEGWYAKQYARTHFKATLVKTLGTKPIHLGQHLLAYLYTRKDQLPEHPNKPILQALLWGDKSQVTKATYACFTQTGTSHLLAISGLHVGMLMGTLANIMAKPYLALVLIWVYVVMALLPPSAMRAALMLTLLTLTKRFGFCYVLYVTLCCHVILNPADILSMGMALSYWAILNIRLLNTLQWSGWFVFPLGLSLLMMPISLWFFHVWPFHAIWINALVIPYMGIVIMPLAFLNLLLTDLALPTCWFLAYWAMDGLLIFLDYFKQGPSWILDSMDATGFVFLHTSVVVMLYQRCHWRSLAWLGVIALVLFNHGRVFVPRGAFAMTMLDVGQGLSIWIKTHRHSVLYDTGTAYAGEHRVVPFLKHHGLNTLTYIIISHWDQDHVGGLLHVRPLAKDMPIITPEPIHGIPCRYGQSFSLDGVKFSFYHPDHALHRARNKDGCVLMVSDNQHQAIILADIGVVEEKKLVQRLGGQQVSLMVAAHHGSRYSNSAALLSALKPSQIWVSAGRDNPYHHPHPEAMQRFKTITKNIQVTANDGQQTFKSWLVKPQSVP